TGSSSSRIRARNWLTSRSRSGRGRAYRKNSRNGFWSRSMGRFDSRQENHRELASNSSLSGAEISRADGESGNDDLDRRREEISGSRGITRPHGQAAIAAAIEASVA